MISCNGFLSESPNLHQICILGFSQLVLKMGDHWPWSSSSFGHFDPEFQVLAFNVTLVYWSRPAKGCIPTCSCLTLWTCIHVVTFLPYNEIEGLSSWSLKCIWLCNGQWYIRDGQFDKPWYLGIVFCMETGPFHWVEHNHFLIESTEFSSLFWRNIQIYLLFLSFLSTEMPNIVETILHGRRPLALHTYR